MIKVSPRPFERKFSNLFDDLFQHLPAQEWGQRLATDSVPMNIRETKEGYVLDVVAPGFEKQDFKISMEGDLLILAAERKNETKSNEERFLKGNFHPVPSAAVSGWTIRSIAPPLQQSMNRASSS